MRPIAEKSTPGPVLVAFATMPLKSMVVALPSIFGPTIINTVLAIEKTSTKISATL